MLNYKNIHIILIGYHKSVSQYYINLDILRKNFSFGDQIHLTTIYGGGKLNEIVSGLGENNFIECKDSGYATGALSSINLGLEFALNCVNRDIVLIHNFDCMFLSEQGFNRCIQEFLDSEKVFSAAIDGNQLFSTDCMIFKKDFLNALYHHSLFPFQMKHLEYREKLEIAERYKNTQLGFNNVEEALFYSFAKYINYFSDSITCPSDNNPEEKDAFIKQTILKAWQHPMSRLDLPRLHFSKELSFMHEHSLNEIKNRLLEYKITKGNFIQQILNNNF